jgi:hypothetical protein
MQGMPIPRFLLGFALLSERDTEGHKGSFVPKDIRERTSEASDLQSKTGSKQNYRFTSTIIGVSLSFMRGTSVLEILSVALRPKCAYWAAYTEPHPPSQLSFPSHQLQTSVRPHDERKLVSVRVHVQWQSKARLARRCENQGFGPEGCSSPPARFALSHTAALEPE